MKRGWVRYFCLVLGVLFGLVTPIRASSLDLSESQDFKAGVFEGTEADSSAGDLKLKTAGAWTQRAWQTPDIALSVGSASVSDGNYVYVGAGGDTWFARYNPIENKWKTLAPLPTTIYYGSDFEYKDGYIYAIFGNYQNMFGRYNIASDSWEILSNTPDLIYRGGSIVSDGSDLYVLRGAGTNEFWKYSITSNSWSVATSTPLTMNQGASLSYYNGYLYTPRGGNTNTFYRYDISAGTWVTRANMTSPINDDTNTAMRGAYVYVMLNNGTTTVYRYSVDGNSWSTMATTPQASRYMGLTYNASDDKIYVFRGNGTYDMWKYDATLNSYSGPADLTTAPGSGADLVYYNGYIYQPRGNNTTTFYRYNVTANTWESLATSPASFNDDTTGVVAGAYLYFYRGSSTTTFYRYDPAANTWATMAVTPSTVGYGGSLSYPGSGDYIYGTRGLYTLSYYRYSISGNSWDDASVADLPNNSEASYGARLLSDGTNLYYVSGAKTGALLKYIIGSNSWTTESMLPYAPMWGTDAVYLNGNIYIQAGYYKNSFWKYNLATGIWTWMDSLQQYYGYDAGPYNGGALAVDPASGILYSILGANILNMATFTVSPNDYLVSGTWTSAIQDLSYVTSWGTLTETATKPSDSSITYETRTSSDRLSFSSWESAPLGVIASPENRYIQVRATLTASTAQDLGPTLSSLSINYQGDVTAPSNPNSFTASSTEVGGVGLVSGTTYHHNYPYFSFTGATDAESGLLGYYVYFGTNASADPSVLGSYQTNADYTVTANLSNNTYYLIVKTKDIAGNVSAATTGFTYVYQGVIATTLSYSTTSEFETGATTNVDVTGDQIRLAGKAGYWMEEAPGLTPAALNYGSGLAYLESSNKLYATRGSNSNSFYSMDLETGTWSTLANTPGTVGYGGDVVEGPDGYLYGLRGINTSSFWRYDVGSNTWDDGAAANTPQTIYYGSSLLYDGSRYIYALRGNNDDAFLRYDTTDNEWASLASVDFGAVSQQVNNTVNYGGDLAYDGDNTLYSVQGNMRTGFAAYNIETDTWSQLAKTPAEVYQGGQIEYDSTSNAIYLIPGWNKPYLYKYSIESGSWSQLPDGPYTFGLGTGMRNVSGKLYVTRANNSRYVYTYDIAKGRWLVPTRGIFGAMFQGTDIRPIGSGADMVKGNGNYLYMTRGNDDNQFVRYETTTGIVTELAGVPSGINLGGALVYESTNNKVYAIASQYNSNLYVYDVSTNVWSQESSDPVPTDPNTGASLAYDGSRYIYYERGGGNANFYRFDTAGVSGNKWSTLTSIPAGVNYGSQLVYKGGYVYVMRGGNVNPNNLYRYDVNAGTWATLTSLSAPIYNDGFLVDSGGDYLYACRGANTANCYRYSVSGDSWSAITSSPGEIYTGGSATTDLAGKMYVFAGSSGNNSFNNGLYTYVMQSETTSVEESGTFESPTIDLGEVYRLANLKVGYTASANAGMSIATRTSTNGTVWENWSSVSEEKIVGSVYEYKINSTLNRYLQVQITLSSSDGVYSGTVSDYTIEYYSDTIPPTNASDLVAYSTATASATLTSDTWYNHGSPYFDWPEAEVSGGATDTTTGSSVTGYYVYLGVDESANPVDAGSFVTSSSFTASGLTSGNTYHLLIKSKDDAGNISATAWAPFIYKYDSEAPSSPSGLSADPAGYTATNNFDFSWGSATDSGSMGIEYCYKTATASGTLASDQCTSATSVTGITGYQTGTNTFYVRARDTAGNYSAYTTGSYYYNSGAPSAPTSLAVTPTTNTVNAFEFSWSAPTAYYGSLSSLKYYYSVNALPTVSSVSRAYSNSLGSSSYATLPGENTLYVVAMDEAGNINYSNYMSVVFTANTTAPGIPTNVDIADVSVKSTSSWKLALSWEEPDSVGAGVETYQVHRSTDGVTYTSRASTSGISYVDTGLTQTTYYYKIKACDSSNNCGAFSDVVELLPDGKFLTPAPLVGEPEVSNLTTIKATVEWTTSRTADSKVSYGTAPSNYFDEEVANSDQVTSHKLVLNNLQPGTTYYFKAKWSDEDGNLGTSDEYSFATAPAPSAKEVKTTSIGLDTVNVQFTSSHGSKAKVYYGVTTAFGGYTEMGIGVAESTYTVQLTGLLDGTKYFYKISLFDSEDNEYEGDTYSFETLPRPKIELVKLQQVKGTATGTVLVTWVTNTAVSSIATYYPSSNPSASADSVDVKLTTKHRKVISDLLPNTAYTLIIKGRDKAGNEASSPAQVFTTSADTRPPSIANLKVESVIQGVGEEATSQLVVSWDTDELGSSQVAYGDGSSGPMASKTQLDNSRTYNHLVVIPNLSPAKVYHLKVLSMDEANNEAESIERVVITPKATKSALNLVVSNLSQAFGFLGGVAGGE